MPDELADAIRAIGSRTSGDRNLEFCLTDQREHLIQEGCRDRDSRVRLHRVRSAVPADDDGSRFLGDEGSGRRIPRCIRQGDARVELSFGDPGKGPEAVAGP